MSIVTVHGPNTWGDPFFAANDVIAVNLLGPLEMEFKSLDPTGDEYEWDFGDDTPPLRVNSHAVRHLFPSPGRYTVKLQGPRNGEITIEVPDGGTVMPLPNRRRTDRAA